MSDFWALIDSEEKHVLSDNFVIQNFKKNEIIYCEGDQPLQLMYLLKGKVKVYKKGIGDRNQIIRLIRPGEYFVYRAYFAHGNYVASGAAIDASQVGFLPMKLVEEHVHRNIDLAFFFIRALADNLGQSDTRTVNLTQKHIRGRLAEAIILLYENYGYEPDSQTLNIYLSREDLANLSNMTTSHAIRTLTAFAAAHILVVDGRKITILDEERLRRISKFG